MNCQEYEARQLCELNDISKGMLLNYFELLLRVNKKTFKPNFESYEWLSATFKKLELDKKYLIIAEPLMLSNFFFLKQVLN